MKKSTTLFSVFVILAIFVVWEGVAVSAVEYVTAPPMRDDPQLRGIVVGEVKKTQPSQLDIITWGGDIATIVGNGNGRMTSKGSIFEERGLNFTLVREDKFREQIKSYLRGDIMYLRGTKGQIAGALELLARDPRTVPVEIYQMTWSRGDVLVVKDYIKKPQDLCGKTVVAQLDGPHDDYLARIVTDACGSATAVKIKRVADLTGTGSSPSKALHDSDVAGVFVISIDALALTSGGKVGDGAEESVKGAYILMSTKTCTTCIPDVYVVRSDYLKSDRDKVEKFVNGLLVAEERLNRIVQNKKTQPADYQQMISAAADILLDSPQAVADAQGLYDDCEFVGYRGNVEFYGNPQNRRNFDALNEDTQSAFVALGLLSNKVVLAHAEWNYDRLKTGLSQKAIEGVVAPKFDKAAVTAVIQGMNQQDKLTANQLFFFETLFPPEQHQFSASMLSKQRMEELIDYALTYGGSIMTVEGHGDNLEYWKAKEANQPDVVLNRIMQVNKTLSARRAASVRDGIIARAQSEFGVTLEPFQFEIIGHGFMKPKVMRACGNVPCPPQSEDEMRNNMRVQFRFIRVEAESKVFTRIQPAQASK